MLPNIAGFQMARDFYQVPTRSMAGLTDSKEVDCLVGYETMQNLMMAMLGGAQIIYEALGVLDGIMATSYEKIIIDEELYRRARRIFQGMDTYDEWKQGGSEELVMKANKIWKERVKRTPETFLYPDVHKDLKAYVESHKQDYWGATLKRNCQVYLDIFQ